MPKAPPKSHSTSVTAPLTAPYNLPPIPSTNSHPAVQIAGIPTYAYPTQQQYPPFNFPPPNASNSLNALPPIIAPPEPLPTASVQSSTIQSLPPSAEITTSAAASNSAVPTVPPTQKRKRITKNNEDPLPWLDIKLEGEENGRVPVYDSCNEIRRKIRAFFSNSSGIKCTQKRFLEVIGNVNCNSYRRFMALKGEGSGAENGTFYGAYVFFEKKRIYEGKAKGKKRLESEQDYPNGRPLQDDARHRYYLTGPGLPPLSQKEIRMSVAKFGY